MGESSGLSCVQPVACPSGLWTWPGRGPPESREEARDGHDGPHSLVIRSLTCTFARRPLCGRGRKRRKPRRKSNTGQVLTSGSIVCICGYVWKVSTHAEERGIPRTVRLSSPQPEYIPERSTTQLLSPLELEPEPWTRFLCSCLSVCLSVSARPSPPTEDSRQSTGPARPTRFKGESKLLFKEAQSFQPFFPLSPVCRP